MVETVPLFIAEQSLAWKIGQMLAIGFPAGEEGFGILERTIGRTLAGNLILFSRNGSSASEAAASASRGRRLVLQATGIDPLVAVDQEGGTVTRIQEGMTAIPGAMAQSAAFLGGKATLSDIVALGEICGSELGELGIDWNLAPVADVNVDPENPVIGVRSFGEDPHLAAAMAAAFARGLAQSGIIATAKHFPGHGDTSVDSHLGLPLIPHSLPHLEAVELLPFRRLIDEGIPAIMSSHLRFPAVEPEPLPATLSARVLIGLLREKLGFRGLICSDCMEMKAVADRYEDRFAMAVLAGVDLLFVSHRADVQEFAAASIRRAVEEGRIPMARIDESVNRVLGLKNLYASHRAARLADSTVRDGGLVKRDTDSVVRDSRSGDLAARIAQGALTVLSPGGLDAAQALRLPGNSIRALVDIAASTSSRAEDRQIVPNLAAKWEEESRSHGQSAFSMRLSADPKPEEIEAALDLMEKSAEEGRKSESGVYPRLALALPSPFSLAGQLSLLERCLEFSARRREPLLVVLMRSPYDLRSLLRLVEAKGAPAPLVLCSYEYSESSAAALAAYLAGKAEAPGKCPARLMS